MIKGREKQESMTYEHPDSAIDKANATMSERGVSDRPAWFSLGMADVLFIFFTLAILQHADSGMMDDPGLGWHLRIADLMWEIRGFIYHEQLCYPTEGQPWVTQAWLGDVLMRLVYGWGGLNGLAVLAALCIALSLRLLYTRMTGEGVNWLVAAFWTFLAALGTSPAWVARPNLFTFPALVLATGICERYRSGAISARGTLWLLPIFLLWPNLHGGFLAGIIVLGVTYLVTCAIALGSFEPDQRSVARRQLGWWTVLGVALFAMTLVNPYGPRLYVWNLKVVSDPFIQSQSTTEWFPPDFTKPGWFRVELLMLLFPALTACSRQRITVLPLALGVVWMHFALTTARYGPLWVLIVVPTLAALSTQIPWLQSTTSRLTGRLSGDAQNWLARTPKRSPCFLSLLFAAFLLCVSPGMGHLAGHNHDLIPSRSLDRLLEIYRGEHVFHLANWGGYLTWHGWSLKPRFKTWIDDRLDTHGRELTADYRAILNGEPGWDELLRKYHVDLVCVPADTPLARHARESSGWRLIHEDGRVVIFRRNSSGADSSPVPTRQDSHGSKVSEGI
jgi:hypothetical protein